jgi:hypothetical protein
MQAQVSARGDCDGCGVTEGGPGAVAREEEIIDGVIMLLMFIRE